MRKKTDYPSLLWKPVDEDSERKRKIDRFHYLLKGRREIYYDPIQDKFIC